MQKTPNELHDTDSVDNENVPVKITEKMPDKSSEKTPEKTLEKPSEKTLDKTPEKTLENPPEKTLDKTPEKAPAPAIPEKNARTPLKETETPKIFEFTTPEKTSRTSKSFQKLQDNPRNENKTPEKRSENVDLKSDVPVSCDGEDEMISTTEQARLLIAASKTPSKSGNRTPAKQKTPSGKRSVENSPGTPGKFRRVELITLASPKAKRLKQM